MFTLYLCVCLCTSDCLGCAVLLYLVVCLALLASFFSSFSHLSLKHVYVCACVQGSSAITDTES